MDSQDIYLQEKDGSYRKVGSVLKTVACIFPGQGSQYKGMCKELYQKEQKVRDLFDRASKTLNIDFIHLCFETEDNELVHTRNAQLAIFLTSYCMYQKLQEDRIRVRYMAGHSLGEITALTCAGAIKFEDALKIIYCRGTLMQEAAEQSMGGMCAIIGVPMHKIVHMCEELTDETGFVSIANYNSDSQIVVSCSTNKISMISKMVEQMQGRCQVLNVAAPFHSISMKEASVKFAEELRKYTFHDLQCEVISNVTGKPYQNSSEIYEKLVSHMTSPVMWLDTMKYFLKKKVGIVIEVGPKNVLKKLMKHYTTFLKVFTMDLEEDRANLDSYLDDLKQSSSVIIQCLKAAVCTPNKNWNQEEYKEGVVKPYKKLRKLQLKLEEENREATEREEEVAVSLLKTLFTTKKVEESEQEYRLGLIYDLMKQS